MGAATTAHMMHAGRLELLKELVTQIDNAVRKAKAAVEGDNAAAIEEQMDEIRDALRKLDRAVQ